MDIRDEGQREVDFIILQDGSPQFLVEVKSRDDKLSPSLKYLQDQLNAPHAFQVLVEAEFVKADCFTARPQPLVAPARTFLSQLL